MAGANPSRLQAETMRRGCARRALDLAGRSERRAHERVLSGRIPGDKQLGYNQAALISKPLAERLRHRAVLLKRASPVLISIFWARRSAGSRFVALLPHLQAAGLTIGASYC
jgi:hypothetical protein